MKRLPVSSIDQPLLFFVRPDLQLTRAAGGGLIATDPIAQVHHELSVEETFLLVELKGCEELSLFELSQRYEVRFAPQRIRTDQLYAMLSGLHQAGMIGVNATGQGEALWRRREERSQTERFWSWTKLLAIKLPGFNPQAMLNFLAPVGRFVFSPLGFALAICLWVIAIFIAIESASSFVAELPAISALTQPEYWVPLLLVIVALKSFHELGHALACRRFGAEVSEMGCLLLMFAPCLYCDVTDTWRLSSRWQRIVITLSGIFFELAIAALAMIVWRYTEPGWMHTVAMQIVLVASLGTLLVNLNPLVRYDGYYLLSDLTNTPNLWQRSRDAISNSIRELFLESNALRIKEPKWLVVYGLLSKLFLGSVLIFFGWLILATARFNRIEVIGWIVVLMIAAGIIFPGVCSVYKNWKKQRMSGTTKYKRRPIVMASMILGALVYLVGFMPMPSSIRADAVVVPVDYELVAVSHEGRLVKALPEGTPVKKGDPIIWLTNYELQKQVATAKALQEQSLLDIRLLESQRVIDPSLGAKLPAARARLDAANKRLNELQSELEKLTIRAHQDGVLVSARSGQFGNKIDFNPLKPKHQGTWLEVGALVAMIFDAEELSVELSVPDYALDRIQIGQRVRIALNQITSDVAEGEISQIARSSSEFSSGEKMQAATWFAPEEIFDQQQTARKVRTSFISEVPSNILVGGGGEARILANPQSLAMQGWYAISREFRLPY